jgi:hypothetical protein
MITESQMYWMTRADDLRKLLEGVGFFCMVVGVIAIFSLIFAYLVSLDDDKTGIEFTKSRLLQWFGPSALAFAFVMLLIRSFIPSTRDYAAIKVVPMILNSESTAIVQKDAGALYNLAVEWAKEQLKGSTNAEQEK